MVPVLWSSATPPTGRPSANRVEMLLTPEELTKANVSRAAFERLLGVSMRLCAHESILEQVVSLQMDQRAIGTDTLPITVLPAQPDQNNLILQKTASNRYLVGIPVDKQANNGVFAVGELEAQPEILLAKLAGLALENEALQGQVREQETQLVCYADQVIQDLEERSWFEELAGLEVFDATKGLEQIAERLLKHLRQIVYAESIAFFAADLGSPDGASDCPPTLFPPRCWLGDVSVDPAECARLVDTYRRESVVQPVVQNWPSSQPEKTQFPGIESFVLVAVLHEGSCIGWLLAVNRSKEYQPPSFTLGFGQESFGTADARLLHSAAVVLATHNQSLNLFQANKDLALGAIQSLAGAVDAKDNYNARTQRPSRPNGATTGIPFATRPH